jgi:hypothetical protein
MGLGFTLKKNPYQERKTSVSREGISISLPTTTGIP